MPLRFLDTNILLYSISRDPTEATKRDRAVALIDADGLRFVGPGAAGVLCATRSFAAAGGRGWYNYYYARQVP
jgi:hypothetical protein